MSRVQEQAQAEVMAADEARRNGEARNDRGPIVASTDRKPSAKQVYCAARLACVLLGEPFPENRRQASELIGKLQAAVEAKPIRATAGDDDIPL